MTLVPLTTCCLSLGVDPKTLRLWLTAARLAWSPHPADARLKCLTLPQLEQVAHLHGRPLLSALPQDGPPVALPQHGTAVPTAEPDQAALTSQMACLRQQVASLQAQVTALALALLAVRSSPPLVPATAPLAAALLPLTDPMPPTTASAPARPRHRSRALPLIQVRSDSSVVVIAPNEGVLPLLPDSAQWFAWLSGLEAFSYEGPAGRFSATRQFRNGQRSQTWTVHCSLHGRSCGLYLGQTPTLTLARLQQIATTVRTRLTLP